MHLKVEKHPVENKARIIAEATTDAEKAELDLLFQAIMSNSRREGTIPNSRTFVVMFETTPEWRNPA